MIDVESQPIESQPVESQPVAGATGRFHGIIPPLLTPLRADGSLDTEALARLVDHLLSNGVHGIFVNGSSGQVAYLTDTERVELLAAVVHQVAGRVPVLSGVADLTARRVAEQARHAAHAGADAVVATAPLYALNDEAEVERHFRMIAGAVDVPVVAYDVPVRVHRKLDARMLVRLAADGVIAGVKDSSGDDVSFRRLLAANAAAGDPMSITTGHEVVCDLMFLAGAHGAVPGLGNVDPAGYVRLWDAAVAGDWDAARAEQERLNRLFTIVNVPSGRSGDATGIGAFKSALVAMGVLPAATMPEPLPTLDADEARAIAAIVAGAGLAGGG